MKFILTRDSFQAETDISERLIQQLSAGKKVLWLTSGGSNVVPQVNILKNIPDELTSNLTIMPNDERYGPVGHQDSNWQEMLDAGLEGKSALLLPVLRDGLDFEETAKTFEETARSTFENNDVVISQLGMGPDGHVSGILPGTAAANEQSAWVVAYEHPPFRRITLTFPAISQVDAVYLLAYGETKKPMLENLRDEDLPLSEQPAQILKRIEESYIYNDQIGEAA